LEIGVEISLYPLRQDYIPPIEDVIARLNGDARLRVVTNSMSTQVFGEYEIVMQLLVRELRTSFEQHGTAVFVMKVLGPLRT
jgi:uncharacterized protein YqgV (UPF0045/DUF77 family)